jgi:hypothetical protein
MRVFVWNKPYEISIYRKSKSVCVATGEYMGGARQYPRQNAGGSRKTLGREGKNHRRIAQYPGKKPSKGEIASGWHGL